MQTPEDILAAYWKYPAFRPLQKDIIASVLRRRDTLALLPTGGGKSLCYQVPALIMPGTCLVISPLIALMQDQVNKLEQLGIPATAIHAGLHPGEVKRILQSVADGGFRLLYLSPERLQSTLFREYLPYFELSFIAVDEAHCIAQWGHDFRPDYLKIAQLRKIFPEAPVLALTATATLPVQEDITRQLRMKRPGIFRQSFRRKNISYQLQYSENKIGDTLHAITALQEQTALIYCRSRRQTEVLSRTCSVHGLHTGFYHAGMTKEKRTAVFRSWMDNELKTIAATTAFGMGIDKPDVRLVLHYDVPEYPEAYYQEAGRAGRDGKPSRALLLYNDKDIRKLRDSIALQYPPENFLRKVYQSVCEYLQLPIGAEPGKYYDFNLQAFTRNFSLPAVQTSRALRLLEQESLWTLTEGVWLRDTLFCPLSRTVLENAWRVHPEAEMILTTALRLYGTLFHYPTPVDTGAIAQKAKLTILQTRQLLRKLDMLGLLEYQEAKDTPQLYFHHRRTDSRHLIIDTNRINSLREQHRLRTEAIIQLLTDHTQCREIQLLDYFGETIQTACGHCDYCLAQHSRHISAADIRTGIAQVLDNDILTTEAIAAIFPISAQQSVMAVFREMIEEGYIIRGGDGKWRKKVR